MVGWLPLAISKDRGCNSRLQQDGWEMTGRLASSSSQVFGCNCRSPRDGWEMAGWLALAISKDFGCHFGSLGDGLEDTFFYLNTQYKQKTIRTTTKPYSKQTTHNKIAGWLALAISKQIWCKSTSPRDGWEMAGRWLGGCPWLFPKIAGVILNRCKMAGR